LSRNTENEPSEFCIKSSERSASGKGNSTQSVGMEVGSVSTGTGSEVSSTDSKSGVADGAVDMTAWVGVLVLVDKPDG
jgi:hypothetical protein